MPLRVQHIFGEVYQYRAGAAVGCNMKRFAKNTFQFIYIPYQIVLFGNRTGDTYDISFLKSIISDDSSWYLSVYYYYRDGIHHGHGDSGYRFCSAGGVMEYYIHWFEG